MTSNIINHIPCATNESNAKSELHATNHVKYVANNQIDEDADEYGTIFPTRFGHESSYNSTDTLCNVDDYNESLQSLDDGGGDASDDRRSTDQQSDCNRSITATPADSSCGFHNTFSVLEEHLNKRPKLTKRQIEYLLWLNKEASVRNELYIDIPITDKQYVRAVGQTADDVSIEANNCSAEYVEAASLFELEIEAMEWLQSSGHATHFNESSGTASVDASYAEEFDTNASLVEEFYQQDADCVDGHATSANEYIYHVAKTRNGQHYIRVLRNLRLDQGKSHNTPNTVSFSAASSPISSSPRFSITDLSWG